MSSRREEIERAKRLGLATGLGAIGMSFVCLAIGPFQKVDGAPFGVVVSAKSFLDYYLYFYACGGGPGLPLCFGVWLWNPEETLRFKSQMNRFWALVAFATFFPSPLLPLAAAGIRTAWRIKC